MGVVGVHSEAARGGDIARWQQGLAAGLALVLGGSVMLLVPQVGAAATSTSFTPSSVSALPATVAVSTRGIAVDTDTANIVLLLPEGINVTTPECIGLFAGARPSITLLTGPEPRRSPGYTAVQLSCSLAPRTVVQTVAPGTPVEQNLCSAVTQKCSGDVLRITLVGAEFNGTIAFFHTPSSYFTHATMSGEDLGTAGTLTLTSAGSLRGDLNSDRVVNGIDLAIFAQDFGKTGTGLKGDLDTNGTVNGIDLAIFAQDFGKSLP